MQKQNYTKQKIIAMPLINLCAAIKKKKKSVNEMTEYLRKFVVPSSLC